MPAAIFNGQYVKVLKDELKAKSGGLFDKVYTSAKSTAFTAATGFTYLVNTGTAVTVTLPTVSAYASIVIKDSTGTAGTTNTGGGGGGTERTMSTTGSPGGSGVVILRIPTANYSSTTTGSPTVTTDGDFTVVKYTGSGSYTA